MMVVFRGVFVACLLTTLLPLQHATAGATAAGAGAQQQQQGGAGQQQQQGQQQPPKKRELPTEKQIRKRIAELKGDDERLFRWDATEHTAAKQKTQCKLLPLALNVIITRETSDEFKGICCDYAAWCITDNPQNRQLFADHSDGTIHKGVVRLIHTSPSVYTSSKAAQLVYISTFANENNHQAYVKDTHAINSLSHVILDPDSEPVQIMWSAAALQNLAASYCHTPDDGTCYWEWVKELDHHHVVHADHSPLSSPGTSARKTIMRDYQLVKKLKHLACGTGPVEGEMSDTNIYPGENAVVGRDESNPRIVPWAAMGALQNMGLEQGARTAHLDDAAFMFCVCRMERSPDWLEEAKASNVLHHLRRAHPCWFGEDGDDTSIGALCVDKYFVDTEGRDCSSYEEEDEEESEWDVDCRKKNKEGVSASEACCACGGGDQEPELKEEL